MWTFIIRQGWLCDGRSQGEKPKNNIYFLQWKGPTEMKRGKEKNTKKKKIYKTHPQRINVLGNCKLLIFSAHYHNFQITASSDKKAIT